ncbi:MAG: LAGLIDADG family homing endonuclease [Nanoarchaeota archaeon]
MKSKLTPKLAEIVGIMIGDGGLYFAPDKKYQLTIAFHKDEKDYLIYVKKLVEEYFKYRFCVSELKNEFLVRNNSVFVGKKLIEVGLKPGNKVRMGVVIPEWIQEDPFLLKQCVRGIFDTDGCIYRKYAHYAQIQFKFGSQKTTKSVREALLRLNFNPTYLSKDWSKGHWAWKVYLSRQGEIHKFFDKIKPMNQKHVIRYKRMGAPRFERGSAGISRSK